MAKKILVIDDDEDMLELLRIIFQTTDFHVILSSKGMSGEDIAVIHPDLVLLDINIKGYITTGDEICKEIKTHPDLKNIPVFLISSQHDLRYLAIECQADGYLSKPFEVSKLRKIINQKLKE